MLFLIWNLTPMILDKLDNAKKYYPLHAHFQKAFEFLMNCDLESLDTGRHNIEGDEIYCSVSKDHGRRKEEAKLEFHNKHIDIQLLIMGIEQIGWQSRFDCSHLEKSYDAGNDFGLCANKPKNWVQLDPGMFAIFFPEDLHAPMVSNDIVHKLVVKVKI